MQPNIVVEVPITRTWSTHITQPVLGLSNQTTMFLVQVTNQTNIYRLNDLRVQANLAIVNLAVVKKMAIVKRLAGLLLHTRIPP